MTYIIKLDDTEVRIAIEEYLHNCENINAKAHLRELKISEAFAGSYTAVATLSKEPLQTQAFVAPIAVEVDDDIPF